MSKRPGANNDNYAKTRKLFLDIARNEFVKNGFANTSTNTIIQRSGMARGSLYYHFGHKEGLFRSVYEQLLVELHDHILVEEEKHEDELVTFLECLRVFLEACVDEKARRILLIDGLTTIPHKERLRILENNLLGLQRKLLRNALDAGYFKGFALDSLMIFFYGAMSETGRALHYTPDPQQRLQSLYPDLEKMIKELACTKQ